MLEYVTRDPRLITSVTVASEASGRQRSGRIAVMPATAIRIRAATANQAERWLIRVKISLGRKCDFHHSGGGPIAADRALRLKAPPVRVPVVAPLLLNNNPRFPFREVNCWMSGALQHAAPATRPISTHQ